MTSKLTKQQRISIVKERFDTIDWQLAMTMEQTDDFYIGLPDRLENENAITWLRRLGRDYRRRLTDISEIVRWAAADNRFNDAILYTQDERIRLTIRQIDQGVFVKVDVLGLALDRYINKTIAISTRHALDQFITVIDLDSSGQGQSLIPDSDDIGRVLLASRINLVVAIIE